MPNTIPMTRITNRIRFALLALGAISLSVAMASPASAQFVSSNASGCRSAIGIAVGRPCLTATPENNGVAQHGSNAGGYTAPQTDAGTAAVNQALQQRAWEQYAIRQAAQADRNWTYALIQGGFHVKPSDSSRIAATPDGRTNASAAPPKAAVSEEHHGRQGRQHRNAGLPHRHNDRPRRPAARRRDRRQADGGRGGRATASHAGPSALM